MLTVYGIANCDTVKKARKWLEIRQLAYTFHDYKKTGIDRATLQHWCTQLGFENLVNQRGTTWRKLSEADRAELNERKAINLMLEHTSLIKRPLIDAKGKLLLGFKESQWQSLL